jgi:hypothetical protein
MSAKNDAIQISCKFETYQLIHRSVVAAARKARQEGNDQQLLALRGALLALCTAEGLTTCHLSDFSMWDVD